MILYAGWGQNWQPNLLKPFDCIGIFPSPSCTHGKRARSGNFPPPFFCPSVPLSLCAAPSVCFGKYQISFPPHHPAGLPPSSFRPPSCSCYVTRPTAGSSSPDNIDCDPHHSPASLFVRVLLCSAPTGLGYGHSELGLRFQSFHFAKFFL